MIELFVFDMAGTTVDERNVVYKTVREALEAAGYSYTQEQVQDAAAGKEKLQAIRDVLASNQSVVSEEDVQRIFSDFKVRLKQAYENLEVSEQSGASDVFQQLRERGVKVVLNTGYQRSVAQNLMDQIGWQVGRDVDGLVTADEVENSRPAPDMIEFAMRETEVSDAKLVAKVGDSQADIEEGKNANCGVTLGITTGAQSSETLQKANPTAVIDRLDQVFDFLGT